MSEPIKSGLDFEADTGEELDIASIFGGAGAAADVNPFATTQPEPTHATQWQAAIPATASPTQMVNPIQAAFAAQEPATQTTLKPAAQSKSAAEQISLFDKPPVFSYGGAKEQIEDASQTFEDLRIAKAEDFPELEEGKKVTWTVKYGKVTKPIADPKGTTIASVKGEIEKSAAFLDGLKKDKDKNPDCLVEPRVTAQSKGIAAYKGVFRSLEEAEASSKVICLIPARDGQIYEMRRTELGKFIAPKNNVTEFSAVRAGFFPALPLIPRRLMEQIITFFRHFMYEQAEFEVLAHIYWDRDQREFVVAVPKQRVSKARIEADLTERVLPNQRYLHYADVHSHNSMKAVFSAVDDRDERSTRLYLVVGELNLTYPSICARVSCGGTLLAIAPSAVMEGIDGEFPSEWLENVTMAQPEKKGFLLPCDWLEAMEE